MTVVGQDFGNFVRLWFVLCTSEKILWMTARLPLASYILRKHYLDNITSPAVRQSNVFQVVQRFSLWQAFFSFLDILTAHRRKINFYSPCNNTNDGPPLRDSKPWQQASTHILQGPETEVAIQNSTIINCIIPPVLFFSQTNCFFSEVTREINPPALPSTPWRVSVAALYFLQPPSSTLTQAQFPRVIF